MVQNLVHRGHKKVRAQAEGQLKSRQLSNNSDLYMRTRDRQLSDSDCGPCWPWFSEIFIADFHKIRHIRLQSHMVTGVLHNVACISSRFL
jgi:hypothetical protein